MFLVRCPAKTTERSVVADYLKLPEVARRLDVSEKTARRMVKSGALPAVFIGGAYRISEEALVEYLENAKVEPGKVEALPSPKQPNFNGLLEEEQRRAELAEWLEEHCGHAYLALAKREFEEMFDRIPEDAPERRELALEVNREYNVFCDFPRNVTPTERLSMRRMIRAAIPEVAVKHGIALMEGGLSRQYQEEAARIFEVQSATESATA
jgi:excisionase family DNA binding protein